MSWERGSESVGKADRRKTHSTQTSARLRFQPWTNYYLASLRLFPHLSNEGFKQLHHKLALWVKVGVGRFERAWIPVCVPGCSCPVFSTNPTPFCTLLCPGCSTPGWRLVLGTISFFPPYLRTSRSPLSSLLPS